MGEGESVDKASPSGLERSPAREQFEQLLEQANKLWGVRRISDAIRLLHRAAAIEPQNGSVQAGLGHLYYQSSDFDRARKHLESAIALDPEDGYAHRIRSCVLGEMGRAGASLAAAEMAVRYETEIADSSVALIEALVRTQKLGRAKQVAATMRSRWPDSVLVHRCLGFLAAEEFKWLEAEGHYRRALKLEPEDSLTLNSLGVALLWQSKRDDARQMFLRAVGVDPNNAVAQHNMGRTFYIKPDDPAYKQLPPELKEEYMAAYKRDTNRFRHFYLSPVWAAITYTLLCIFSPSISFSFVTVFVFSWTVMATTALVIYGQLGYPPRSVWEFNCGISSFALLAWGGMWALDATVAPSSFNQWASFSSLSFLLLLSSYRLICTLPSVLRFQERREAEREFEKVRQAKKKSAPEVLMKGKKTPAL